jgi:ribosomal protein S11
VLKATLGP